ncbi:type II toxin-antitoxin system RelE/ParE family toxin [Reichenbachiella ulvae]|uniref:ParE toxin of type II toxin-antitoxin system, parDE n=1 Tax=Reichenbachiella ulvae TaxID=2980104 RepID=A0ABT3CXJ3_9BACT|nr:hypothetical protein [Reichenbachiella ulvae]MCV9388269.1 hypothetical protein [Reichenbachiella ulvae]
MDYEIVIKPDAEIDIRDAVKWYEDKKEGLGLRFIKELDQKLIKIRNQPLLYQKRYKLVRMAILSVFKEAIHFTVEENRVYVHAVLATARDPKIWNKLS